MRISKNGLDLIKSFEGLRLSTYKCSAGVDTIGYGSTGKHVKPGLTITEGEAEALLRRDVYRFEDAVNKLVRVEINQDQFDALVSISYNIGVTAISRSTLMKKVNAMEFDSAKLEFARWAKANGKTMPGLARRRSAEARLFEGGDWRGAI